MEKNCECYWQNFGRLSDFFISVSDVTSVLPVTVDWEECASHHIIICESCQSFP